jgi:hypothetical protein
MWLLEAFGDFFLLNWRLPLKSAEICKFILRSTYKNILTYIEGTTFVVNESENCPTESTDLIF